jgi:hypothetical protein
MTEKLVQALHAGISRRDWHATEVAANAIREALRALSLTGSGRGVKALEWADAALVHRVGLKVAIAATPFGEYWVVKGSQGRFDVWLDGWVANGISTKEEAKAAAQADFNARINSALSPEPTLKQTGSVVADCANEGHDHPAHDWRTACLKCGIFKGSDLYASEPITAREVTAKHIFRNADDSDWDHLFVMLHDTGRGRFWKAVLTEMRALLASLNTSGDKL